MGAIKTIAVLIAMEAEAEPLISSFKLLPCPKSHHHAPLPSVVRSGEISFGEENKAVEIVLVTCGQDATHAVDSVGTVNAALCAYEVLKTHRPDVLINAGTAGGFQSKGCEIGDVFLVSEVKFHDRRIPIPTFTSYGIGAIETLKTPNMRKEITSLKSGICSTGNSLDATDVDREMMLQNDASVKEMEAAAVAKVCEMFKTPFVCVKAITDIVDGRDGDGVFGEFSHGWKAVARNRAESVGVYEREKRRRPLIVEESEARDDEIERKRERETPPFRSTLVENPRKRMINSDFNV